MSPRPPPAHEVVLDGLYFPEGPRWHEGKLWFSDMHGHRVMTVGLDGAAQTVVNVPAAPSGLGWLPDGRLLVVSMEDRRLLRLDPSGLTEVADLSRLATFHCNDMVVDAQGRAYVGNFGFDLHAGAEPAPAAIVLVLPNGEARVAAADLMFPNGTVITSDGRTLIVGESFGPRLTAFDVEPDGSLSNRRVWAALASAVPDGMCLDAEDAIWVASPISAEVLRVREGGAITHRVSVSTQAFACMLGGPQRRHLFICTASSGDPAVCREKRDGRIEVVEVEVPGAGLP
jgi:sugar lactone lactonase YvrE